MANGDQLIIDRFNQNTNTVFYEPETDSTSAVQIDLMDLYLTFIRCRGSVLCVSARK